MKILPYEKFEVRTDLSKEEIQKRLLDCSLYKGESSLDEFNLQQIRSHRTGVAPRIKGKVVADSPERRIKVIVKLPSVGLALLAIFFLVFLGIAIESVITDSFSSSSDRSLEFFTISLIALVIGLIFTKYEVLSSKRKILKLLVAKPKSKK